MYCILYLLAICEMYNSSPVKECLTKSGARQYPSAAANVRFFVVPRLVFTLSPLLGRPLPRFPPRELSVLDPLACTVAPSLGHSMKRRQFEMIKK